MADACTYPTFKPRDVYVEQTIRVGRATIMTVTYLVLAWSLSQSVRGGSMWTGPLVLLTIAALMVHFSDRPTLLRSPRLHRFAARIADWKGCAFLLIFGVWYGMLIGPATETRYFIHPATWMVSHDLGTGTTMVSLYYNEHPRRALAGRFPRSVNEPIGGEGIFIFDVFGQDFASRHLDMDGETVSVVLSQVFRFGATAYHPSGYSLHSVGEFPESEGDFTWAANDTEESMKIWSPIGPGRALTKFQAERVLGHKLP